MPEFDGRFELDLVYSVTISSQTLTHHHRFDIKLGEDPEPGTEFGAIGVVPRVGSPIDLDVWLQDYVDVWSPQLGAGTTLEEVILWRYDDEPSLAKIYISSASPLPTMSNAGTPLAAQGSIMTFRIAGYRYPMRMYIMEGIFAGEGRYPVSSLPAEAQDYADFVVAPASPIVGRSDGYPIAAIALNLGQNEKLRNLRFR